MVVTYQSAKPGMTSDAIVKKVNDWGVVIQFEDSSATAIVLKEDCDDNEVEDVRALYAVGDKVRAVVLEGPCVSLVKGAKPLTVDREACLGCRRCVRELGCPALFMQEGKAQIDASLCTGCTLCQQVCPVNCLKGGAGRE